MLLAFFPEVAHTDSLFWLLTCISLVHERPELSLDQTQNNAGGNSGSFSDNLISLPITNIHCRDPLTRTLQLQISLESSLGDSDSVPELLANKGSDAAMRMGLRCCLAMLCAWDHEKQAGWMHFCVCSTHHKLPIKRKLSLHRTSQPQAQPSIFLLSPKHIAGPNSG